MSGIQPRPWQLSTASVLWIVLGSVLTVGVLQQMGQHYYYTGSPGALLMLAIGVVTVVFGVLLRRGAAWTRIPLTAMGAITCIGLWPLLLVVPAAVLQFHLSSRQWLALPRAPR